MTEYDFIIIGAGAAGLMLADGMGKDPAFRHRKILLLDRETKRTNDRTWCYWEKDNGPFDEILHKRWDQIYLSGENLKKTYDIAPYSYKMVRGIDFYSDYLSRIQTYSHITFLQESVTEISEDSDGPALVRTTKNVYRAQQVFNSLFTYQKIGKDPAYPILKQHFIGWFIRTKDPVFHAGRATFMDFSIPQKGNTRFMYVLPFSEYEALVEYTLFSPKLLRDEEYEEAIREYMVREFKCPDYEITDREKGSIPMTCYDFAQHNTPHIFHIGTAGGWSKPSTGYTFMNTAKKTDALLRYLKSNKPLSAFQKKSRFWYYDLLLLNILYRNNELGKPIFESLFKKRKPQLILKFLDEETSWYEDVYIMMAPNPIPFIKSLIRHLFWAVTGKKKRW
ncbi:lycopene beta-cyclase [Muriicola jejuensis]|uniref:Lycopene cyclase n=1 Tax=Muriicola jejuensis TaxID=504488 RepID=A0A6P0U950_9FLAO|nr:lycopene cyclase family protein [Muriicola jejuensis]NER09735.1 lycopene cyclase [Muriicola jejuensis]SMP06204.1 lycopene beta-cyclase [Muriicola jejuensis]